MKIFTLVVLTQLLYSESEYHQQGVRCSLTTGIHYKSVT